MGERIASNDGRLSALRLREQAWRRYYDRHGTGLGCGPDVVSFEAGWDAAYDALSAENERLRSEVCYCVCHSPVSSNAYCRHCKGDNSVGEHHRLKAENERLAGQVAALREALETAKAYTYVWTLPKAVWAQVYDVLADTEAVARAYHRRLRPGGAKEVVQRLAQGQHTRAYDGRYGKGGKMDLITLANLITRDFSTVLIVGLVMWFTMFGIIIASVAHIERTIKTLILERRNHHG